MWKRTLLLLSIFAHLPGSAETLLREQVVMGTFAAVWLEEEAASSADLLFERMRRVERSLSSYREDGGVRRLNRDRRIAVDADLLQSLALCGRLHRETEGYFTCSVGSITKGLYRFGTDRERLPSEELLDRAELSWEGVSIEKDRVRLSRGIQLDLGGLGKGFGVDRAVEILKRRGIGRAVVAIGGDIRCLGPCRIGIQNPFGEGVIGEALLPDGEYGLTTSGTYRRFVRSREHHHLIDPTRRRSAKSFRSVTLGGALPSALLDGYATAIAVMPPRKALRFLQRRPAIDFLLIAPDGSALRRGRSLRLFGSLEDGFVLHPALETEVLSRRLRRGGP